jgi:class 3 adenylate cyclase
MFADIVGFNAWSSEREPHQIFQLLEILYQKFDLIAQQMGIVKIESNGDSYIAVAGLLEHKSNHAITMARFSVECKLAMSTVIEEMELILGPGTADLGIRFGLHSGPVIAGILHEVRQRLQLFGDTVNIASRLEATSSSGSIHVSQETASLIAFGGMKNWLFERSDLVYIKGKGNLKVSQLSTSKSFHYRYLIYSTMFRLFGLFLRLRAMKESLRNWALGENLPFLYSQKSEVTHQILIRFQVHRISKLV